MIMIDPRENWTAATSHSTFHSHFLFTGITSPAWQSLPRVMSQRRPLPSRMTRCQFHQRSMSSFCNSRSQKGKRYLQLDWILTLLGATGIKAVHEYVGEIKPRCQSHQHSTRSFYACRSQKRKKYWHLDCIFCVNFINVLRAAFTCKVPQKQGSVVLSVSFLHFWDLHEQKLGVKCWWNWPQIPVEKKSRKPAPIQVVT